MSAAIQSRSLGLRILHGLGRAVLAVLIALAFSRLPHASSIELKDAPDMTIDRALRLGGQLGDTLISAGGPLAGLATGTHSGLPAWPQFWWQLFFNLTLGTILAWFTLRLARPYRWWFLAALVCIAAYRPAAAGFSVIFLAGLLLARWRTSWLPALGAGAVLGTIALLHVSHALLGLLACTAAFFGDHDRPRRQGVLALAGLTVFFAAGWIVAGQSLSHVPAWFFQGLSLLRGQEDFLDPLWWTMPTKLAALGVAVGAGWLLLGRGHESGRTLPARLTFGLFGATVLWLCWRQSIGHPDGWPQVFFCVALFLAASWPALDPTAPIRLPGAARALATAAIFGLLVTEQTIITQAIIRLNHNLVVNANAFTGKSAWQRELRTRFRANEEIFGLARIKETVGARTVDMVGDDGMGYLFFSGLQYAPRPTLLSLSAATPALAGRNGDHYLSPAAPEFVIQRLQARHEAVPALSDAAAQLALYRHYDFLYEEHGFLLWQKRSGPSATSALPAPVWQAAATWDQAVNLPVIPNHACWLSIHARPSLLGRVLGLFFPAGNPTIVLRDAEGNLLHYRLPLAPAWGGFLLNPFFRGEIDQIRYQAGLPVPFITGFTLEAPALVRLAWRSRLQVELRELPLPPATGRQESAATLTQRYRMFNRMPVTVTAPYPPTPLIVDQREVLLANPDSVMEFPVHAADRTVSGSFGLPDSARLNGNTTDGAEFIVTYHPAGGNPVELFRRFLDPMNEPADRGFHSFRVTLPAPVAGRVILRTTNPPDHHKAFDWTFWTDLRFE